MTFIPECPAEHAHAVSFWSDFLLQNVRADLSSRFNRGWELARFTAVKKEISKRITKQPKQ